MRDPKRIDRIVSQLREVWMLSPDLRLSQLIVNAIRPTDPCQQIFYAEDDVVERGLHDFLMKLCESPKSSIE
jgi:hypothetical protein